MPTFAINITAGHSTSFKSETDFVSTSRSNQRETRSPGSVLLLAIFVAVDGLALVVLIPIVALSSLLVVLGLVQVLSHVILILSSIYLLFVAVVLFLLLIAVLLRCFVLPGFDTLAILVVVTLSSLIVFCRGRDLFRRGVVLRRRDVLALLWVVKAFQVALYSQTKR